MSYEIEQLRTALVNAKQTITEQAEILEKLAEPPHMFSSVLEVTDTMLTVLAPGGMPIIVPRANKKLKISVGDTILMSQEGMITGVRPPLLLGDTHSVQSVSDKTAEIGANGSNRIVIRAEHITDLAKGDKVLLDPSGRVIIHRIVEHVRERFDFTVNTNVEWDDIGGQIEAKQQMIEAVELPLKQAKLYQFYNKKPVKGILLYGPPGCGKTLLAKAAATSVARAFGDKSPSGFMYVKGPEVLDPYVGVAEATIRGLFQKARIHKAETGSPAVIFIDEADALLGTRGARHGGMETTIVPQFLTEMDGLEESAAIVILATNRPDTLDPAIVREGRIDRKVRVSRPTPLEAKVIFELNMRTVPLAARESLEEIITAAVESLYNTSRLLYSVSIDGETPERRFTMANIISGSTVANIAEQAVSIALRRDITANAKKPTGVSKADVLEAIENVYMQNRDVNHNDALVEFADGDKIINLRRVTNVAKAA